MNKQSVEQKKTVKIEWEQPLCKVLCQNYIYVRYVPFYVSDVFFFDLRFREIPRDHRCRKERSHENIYELIIKCHRLSSMEKVIYIFFLDTYTKHTHSHRQTSTRTLMYNICSIPFSWKLKLNMHVYMLHTCVNFPVTSSR